MKWATASKWDKASFTAALSAAIFGVGSVILAIPHFGTRFNIHCHLKVAQAIVLSIWIVGPPIWFWYEYFHLYRPAPEPKPDLDSFKYGQDQAAKIWLALVTLLLALYFGKDFTRG
jgi:hypothetical protein